MQELQREKASNLELKRLLLAEQVPRAEDQAKAVRLMRSIKVQEQTVQRLEQEKRDLEQHVNVSKRRSNHSKRQTAEIQQTLEPARERSQAQASQVAKELEDSIQALRQENGRLKETAHVSRQQFTWSQRAPAEAA